jgi:thioredoxin-like negative regulator of GroEL
VDYLSKRPQAGELSTDPAPQSVAMRVDELARDPQRRRQLAEGAVAAGKEDFDYEKAFGRFCAALSGSKEFQDNQR